MTATPSAAAAPPVPSAPGFAEIFEQSLIAVADPSVFRRAAARPAPSFGVSSAFALACGAAAALIAAAHFVVSGAALPFSPPVAAAAAVAVAGVYASLLLLLSVLLYGAGGALGAKGDFERALQAAAMLSVWAPAQALCGWFPLAWMAPALLAAWVAAGALVGLFNARPGAARALALGAAAAAIGLQFLAREFVARTYDAYVLTQTITSAQAATGDAMAALQKAAADAAPNPTRAGAFDGGTSAAVARQTSTSGLDLLRGPSEDGDSAGASPPPAAPATTGARAAPTLPAQPADNAAAQAMQASAAGMLDALTPMLNMLTASPNLRPEQKADIKALQGMMGELKTDMASGKKLDDAVFQEKMRRYQTLLLKVMAYAPAPASAGAPPSRQPSQDGR